MLLHHQHTILATLCDQNVQKYHSCYTNVCILISVTKRVCRDWLQKVLSDMMGKATGNQTLADKKVFLYSAVSWRAHWLSVD